MKEIYPEKISKKHFQIYEAMVKDNAFKHKTEREIRENCLESATNRIVDVILANVTDVMEVRPKFIEYFST